MTHESDIKAAGAGLAGGAIAAALLDTLLDKKLITLADARSVLDRASNAISAHVGTPAGREAIQTIAILMNGRFSEHGHNK
ncbi:MAG TPA: hypothetical protein VIE66_08660 [Methylocella sp.]|jgi:malic enzyme